jgi:uncharacterized membrane protein YgaE (UPF0421/DUF939 family)
VRLRGRDLGSESRVAIKMALASSLSWWLATLAGEQRPVFAALVGLIALSGDPFSALNVSIARILGVFVGVAIGIGVLQLDVRFVFVVVIALVAGTLAGIPLRVGDRPNIQPAVSALFLVALGRSGAFHAGVARLWETAIGAGIALLVAVLVWPPHPVRELHQRLDRLRRRLAGDLGLVAGDLAFGSQAVGARMEDIRTHSVDAVREVLALEQARQALRFNPLRRRDVDELAALEERVNLAARLYRHARAIARDVSDTAVESVELGAALRAIAEAADVALRGEDARTAVAAADERLTAIEPGSSDVLVVRAQLRQMLDDLRQAADDLEPATEPRRSRSRTR